MTALIPSAQTRLTIVQVLGAGAILLVGAMVWTKVTTEKVRPDPHADTYGDVPYLPSSWR